MAIGKEGYHDTADEGFLSDDDFLYLGTEFLDFLDLIIDG
jgi:hypothetical protein